jgi:hypothetical protein
MDYNLQREIRGLKNDKLMSERAVNYEKNKWANLLSGEMGKDINDVLSGKVKVKLSWKERYKYKIKRLINNLRKNKDKNAEIE